MADIPILHGFLVGRNGEEGMGTVPQGCDNLYARAVWLQLGKVAVRVSRVKESIPNELLKRDQRIDECKFRALPRSLAGREGEEACRLDGRF